MMTSDDIKKHAIEASYDGNILTVIVPVYNEAEVLQMFYDRLHSVLVGLEMEYEILFVNDGSRDDSIKILQSLHLADSSVSIIDLSRNFGKEIAMTAGLDYADGDAVVIIDSDLQDPPELIPDLIRGWREGFDVVYAKRIKRDGETALKRATASVFYKIMLLLSPINIPADTGDFRLLSRRAVLSLRRIREKRRFMKGLFAWIGYPEKEVLYNRDPRKAGDTKWNYWRLWNLALEGITSFSEAPLKLATYIGTIVAAFSFLYGIFVIVKTLLFGDPVAGYPSLMTAILFFSGVQLIFVGILGEYLARMFAEVKGRPLYLIQNYKATRKTE